MRNTIIEKIVLSILLVALSSSHLSAETVSGGGYTVQQIIAPIEGAISGNGYIVNQSAQVISGSLVGGGSVLNSSFGTGTEPTSTPVIPPNPPIVSGGGGYFILPTPVATTTATTTKPDPIKTIITENGSSCASRVVFSAPIDIGAVTNVKSDVMKLEIFLNTYEHENLKVNGIYEAKDIAAVKRWQLKYKTFILDPMHLKKPTGTVYTLSQRQIERQTTKACGEPVVVNKCPYFTKYTSYGDRGDEVKKIQLFLNIVQGEKLVVSGVYGPLTKAATKRFQQTNRKWILNILKLSFISGNWNEATRIKANELIGCDILK